MLKVWQPEASTAESEATEINNRLWSTVSFALADGRTTARGFADNEAPFVAFMSRGLTFEPFVGLIPRSQNSGLASAQLSCPAR